MLYVLHVCPENSVQQTQKPTKQNGTMKETYSLTQSPQKEQKQHEHLLTTGAACSISQRPVGRFEPVFWGEGIV